MWRFRTLYRFDNRLRGTHRVACLLAGVGAHFLASRTTNDDPLQTSKIALAHLTEFPDYYTRLAMMEAAAKAFWDSKSV